MTEAGQASGLWDYAVALYGKPGVAEACIALQDDQGLDVNLLLCCCWAGNQGRVLGPDRCRALVSATAAWQEQVVKPLRGVRRWLKRETYGDQEGSLRAQVMAVELDAERAEQEILEAEAGSATSAPSLAAAAGNLKAYLAVAGTPTEPSVIERLTVILTAAFPDTDKTEVRERLAL